MHGDFLETKILERYIINKEIGTGGFSKVYEVYDTHVDKRYAMKIMLSVPVNAFGQEEKVKKEEEKRMLREIQMLRKLSHKGLPRLHDVFKREGELYIVMELVEGITLYEYVKRKGRLSIYEALELGKQLCEILKYLHSRSVPVIYGDLKPQNIIIKEGTLRLIDLGGAFIQDEMGHYVYGTLGYAAPELQKGKLYPCSDVYSFGKILLFMLTGVEDSFCKFDRTKGLRRFGIYGRFMGIIRKCLHVQPECRYYSAIELSQALSRVKGGKRNFPGKGWCFIGTMMETIAFLQVLLVLCYGGEFFYEDNCFWIGCGIFLLSFILKKRGKDLYKTAILEYECRILFTQKENA